MMRSGTIRPDGRVKLAGCEDNGATLLAINPNFIVIHNPSGRYYDNGGENRVAAWVEVHAITDLRRAGADGGWEFVLAGHMGSRIDYHPTPKKAREQALDVLQTRGDRMVETIKKRKEGKS